MASATAAAVGAAPAGGLLQRRDEVLLACSRRGRRWARTAQSPGKMAITGTPLAPSALIVSIDLRRVVV